jgi:hypothetical protein
MEALLIFIKTFGPMATGGFLGIGLLTLLIVYIISAVTGRNFGFELGPFKLNTHKNGSGDKVEKIKTMLNFDSRRDTENSLLDTLVDAIKNKTRDKDVIEFQQTVINQMSCAEDFNIQIKSIMTDTYAKLMKAKDGALDVRHHRDYKFYQVLVSSILDELKRNTLKDSIKSIDIIALSPQEFEQFSEQKINVMIAQIDQYLELMYQTNSIVSWDDVHKENENILPKIRELYRTLYYKIKNIVLEDSKSMQEIDEQMNNDVTNIKNQISKGCVISKIETILEEPTPEKKG